MGHTGVLLEAGIVWLSLAVYYEPTLGCSDSLHIFLPAPGRHVLDQLPLRALCLSAQVRPRAPCLLSTAPEPLAYTLGLAVVQYLWLRCTKPGTLESGLDALPPSLSVGPMLTFPGNTVPTDGEMVMGELGGTKNSKDVGPTGVASSDPIRGKEWISLFMLR